MLFKDKSGTIGVYFKDNTAVMAFNQEGEMDVTESTDPDKEYSRGRGLSFGLRLVEDRKFPYHGKPITQKQILDQL